jgi:putative two-component system response regulator
MTANPTGPRGRILIVDDQEINVRILERILDKQGFEFPASTTDPRQALQLFLAHQPDLVLLDLHMPYLDGFAVLDLLRPYNGDGTYLPILVLTADLSAEAKTKALSMGAKDFLAKPFDTVEVILRIRNLLEARFLHLNLQRQNELLEQKVRERTRELEAAQLEILERLAFAAEFRDDATKEHTRRVGELSARLAARLQLPADVVELIRLAAPLHDLGKIAIPDQLLLKAERLSAEEFESIKGHTSAGARILGGSRYALLQLAEQIALTHHEHWDGHGYTPGLQGEDIPLAGRIVAIADVFDALTHPRPYKPAWDVYYAMDEIERQRGRKFDPHLVDAFREMLREDGLFEASTPSRAERERVDPGPPPDADTGATDSSPESEGRIGGGRIVETRKPDQRDVES